MEPNRNLDAGLSRPLARPTFLFGWVVLTAAAVVGHLFPPIAQWGSAHWLAVLALATDFTLATSRRPGRLPWPHVVVMIGGTALALVASFDGWMCYLGAATPYAYGLLNMGIALLILRGHSVVGTMSSVGIMVVLVAVETADGASAAQQFGDLAPLLVTIIAVWVVYFILRSIMGGRKSTVARQLRAAVRIESTGRHSFDELHVRQEIAVLTEPILRRISVGEPMSATFRSQIVAVDEQVRNLLRRDLPSHDGLLRSIAAARDAGMLVRVFGGEDSFTRQISNELAASLIDLLSSEDVEEATIRFQALARGGTTTVLLKGPSGARRYELDPAGVLLREAR